MDSDSLLEELNILRARVAQLERECARQKRIEEALQKSEERYRTLVETMNEGLGLQDEQGKIIYVNDKLSRMLGYARSELVGRPFSDLVAPSYLEMVQQRLASPTGPEDKPVEVVLRRKDGGRCMSLFSPSPIIGSESDFRGTFAIFTDISRLKEAERAFDEERNLLRTLMDSIPDYAYIKDRESRFISTNTPHLTCVGARNLSEVIGKTDYAFFPEELAREYYADEQRVMATGVPLLNKIEQGATAAGEAVWLMTFKAPLRDRAGRIVGLVGVSRDITDLRRAERALRESEDRFRLILENTRDIAYKLNFDENAYEYVSPSCLQLAGVSSKELIQIGIDGFYDRVHPDDRERLREHRRVRATWTAAAQTDIPPVIEYRFCHKDESYRWVAETAGIVRNEKGRPIGEIGTIRDITESKAAEQAIRTALRMEATATLAGGIAHDFNNLMVGVLGNAELLQMRMGNEDAETFRMLNTIASTAQKAGELAQQMLAFAHGGKYQPSVINLNQLVEDTVWLEKRSVPPGVEMQTRPAPDLWNTLADPAQMNQVVMNMLINALEAVENSGVITLSTGNAVIDKSLAERLRIQPGEYVMLKVEDTGIGMTPSIKARVFEPFFSTKFQGRGLGLAAVYGIVTNHGGSITVESELNRGSQFTVYLPAVESRKQSPAKTAGNVLMTGTETILLVDDEAVVLDVTRSILQRLGYTVLCASDGQEAVDAARSHEGDIHLVLLDLAMPVMGGAQAFPLIKEARPKAKVIIYSGFELDPAAQAVLDAGANDYIQKPFRTRSLADRVRQVLDN